MTFEEIIVELQNAQKMYYEEISGLTSVQIAGFNDYFAKIHNIDRVTSGSEVELFKLKIKINDTVSVKDVRVERLQVRFAKYKDVYRIALSNGFSFLTKSRKAVELRIGQNINVSGVVNARITGKATPMVMITPISTFSVKFQA